MLEDSLDGLDRLDWLLIELMLELLVELGELWLDTLLTEELLVELKELGLLWLLKLLEEVLEGLLCEDRLDALEALDWLE